MKINNQILRRTILFIGMHFFFIAISSAQEYPRIGIKSDKTNMNPYYKIHTGSIIVADTVESPFSAYVRPGRHVGADSLTLYVPVKNTISTPVRLRLNVTIVDQDEIVHLAVNQFMILPSQSTRTFDLTFIEPYLNSNDEFRLKYSVNHVNVSGSPFVNIQNQTGSFPFKLSSYYYSHENSVRSDSNSSMLFQTDPYYWMSFYRIGENADGSYLKFTGVDVASFAADGKLDDEKYTIYLLEWSDPNDNIPQLSEILPFKYVSPLDHPFVVISAFAAVEFDKKETDQHEIKHLDVWNADWFDVNGAQLSEFQLKPGTTYILCAVFLGDAVGPSLVNRPTTTSISDILVNPFGAGEYKEGFPDVVPVMRLKIGN